VNYTSMAALRLGERFRVRMLEALEEFALSALPHGPLRRWLLEWVERQFARSTASERPPEALQ
jgi:hypothetical protein